MNPRVDPEELARCCHDDMPDPPTGRGSIITALARDLRDARAQIASLQADVVALVLKATLAHDILQPHYSRGESVPDEDVYEALSALRSVMGSPSPGAALSARLEALETVFQQALKLASLCEDARDLRMAGVDPSSREAADLRRAMDNQIVAVARAADALDSAGGTEAGR